MWIKPGRTDLWWQNLICNRMARDEWKLNFRLDRSSFLKLLNLIAPYITEPSYAVRYDAISTEKKLAMTLYYLKDQGSFRMTANTFGCGISTVSKVIREICHVLADKIGPKLIKFPQTVEDIELGISIFQKKFGFPQAIGCVDGTHIPIKRPSENSHDYFCYKQRFSINVQAICDANGLFTDVEIRWPGSVHDARVFANSQVNKMFVEKRIPLVYRELVPGDVCVPQLLLGDPAYPLLYYMLKEYISCADNQQVVFNQMLRSARNQIECAFGRLKARFRILNKPLDVDIEFIPTLIYSCFVLHNFCEKEKVDIAQDDLYKALLEEHRSQSSVADKIYSCNSVQGIKVRDAITNYFSEYL